MIFLREVDISSVEQCSKLKCTEDQLRFTNSPIWTLLQASYDNSIRGKCKVYAIFCKETVVGMVRLDFSVFDNHYEFTDLIIDKDHQRKHYATDAIKEVIGLFLEDGKHRTIRIHVAKENTSAIRLYEKSGFVHQPDSDNEYFYSFYLNI